jgi:hypothetical protein
MADRIEVRDGVTFELDGATFCLATNRYDELELRSNGFLVDTVYPGGYVYRDWEIHAPDGAASPDAVAILAKRSERYRAGRVARGFIEHWNVHDGAKPVNLRALLKRRGGRINNHGHLFPGVSARLMSPPAGFQVFWRDADDENRRQELIALTLAARHMDRDTSPFATTIDYDFSDTLTTRPDLHWFATLLLVPADLAAHAGNMESAFWIGEELHVDPHRVHNAHHLWNEITHPEIPGA